MAYPPSDPRAILSYGPSPMVDPNSLNSGVPYGVGQPVLMNPAQPNVPPPALRQPLQTGNARGSSRMPTIEPQKINMMGEGMIRMGSAMGAQQGNGLNAGMAAAGQEYGNIMDYNRAGEAEAQALEEARRVELQRRMDAQANAQAKAKADKKPKSGADMIMAQESLDELNTLITALEDGGLTGPLDGTVQAWLDQSGIRDFFKGNDAGAKRAYYRQRLENFRVNEALAITSKTKGAISDSEMKLFLDPIPATADTTEATWLFHLREKLRINSKILAFEQGAASGGGDFSFVD